MQQTAITVESLYSRDGLIKLDGLFCQWLQQQDADGYAQLMIARAAPDAYVDESALLIRLAPWVEAFIGEYFAITDAVTTLQQQQLQLQPLAQVKRLFVQRQAIKKISTIRYQHTGHRMARGGIGAGSIAVIRINRRLLLCLPIGWSIVTNCNLHKQ